jgi:hypothetical protein
MPHQSDESLVHVVIVNGGQANMACSIIKSFTSYSSG